MKAKGLSSVAISPSSRRSFSSHEQRGRRIVAQVDPGRRNHLLLRPRADWPARTRKRRPTECGPRRPGARYNCGLRAGAPRLRHRRAAFITQNDGTVAEAAQARRLPVYSFASGATNSMRGGAYLSGLDEATNRRRRDHHRRGPAQERLSSRGQLGSQDRRRRTLFRMPDLNSIVAAAATCPSSRWKIGPLLCAIGPSATA